MSNLQPCGCTTWAQIPFALHSGLLFPILIINTRNGYEHYNGAGTETYYISRFTSEHDEGFFFLWEYEDTCNLIILSNINISERTSAEYMLTKKDYFVLSI